MIEVLREERVLRVTLNRPDGKNALDEAMCRAIVDAVESARDDAQVGAVLLESRGEMFCAGLDADSAPTPDTAERLFTLGARMRKPILASVMGPALGAGVGLMANAHIVVAAHGSSFGLTEIRHGGWPFVTWRALERALGERRAVALALTGRIFSVNEALQWGLVHEVAPMFEVDDRATAIAHHVAGMNAEAIDAGLEFVQRLRASTGD